MDDSLRIADEARLVKLLGVFEDFFDGGVAFKDVLDAVFAQGGHAQFDGFLPQDDGGYVLGDEFFDGV